MTIQTQVRSLMTRRRLSEKNRQSSMVTRIEAEFGMLHSLNALENLDK